ncbi:MAG: choice-of-anchor D domain-containing protein [Acidimicrobiia bacterium]|nr:choice-of-anchor D domain-containing protein [Acidimicrobiia bacterium]
MAGQCQRGRYARIAAGVLGAGIILSAASASVSARPHPLESSLPAQLPPIASTGEGVTISEGIGSHATVSGDGRFVVYEGVVPLDDAVDAPLRTTVFLADRTDGTNIELAPLSQVMRSGATIRPVVSRDGCTVVAHSEIAFDVFRDDDVGHRWDVYRTILPHCGGTLGEWELVSTRRGETAVARNDVVTQPAAVSRGGTIIAYTHAVDHLPEAEGLTTISVVDLEIPIDSDIRSQLASGIPVVAPDSVFVHAGLDQPALSHDGRFLAFRSDATSNDAVPQWAVGSDEGGPATAQVYVWDRLEADPFAAVILASSLRDGTGAIAGASEPTLSRDGGVVAFVSADPNIIEATFDRCDGGCPSQVYRLDRDADGDAVFDGLGDGAVELSLVSRDTRAASPIAGTGDSTSPSLSADGEQIAFVSRADNLDLIYAAGGGTAEDGALYLADAQLGSVDRVSGTVIADRRGSASFARPQLSDTSRTLVFDMVADAGVVPHDLPDDNSTRQVVAVTQPPTLSLPETNLGTTLVGLTSDQWYVAVVNDGPSGFVPATVTIDDPHFEIDMERSTCALGSVVPPGGDCTIRVGFTPSTNTSFSGVLTVAEQGFGAVSISSAVSGSGGEPALRADPAGADLGRVVVGSASAEFHFDVANISVFPTSIASVQVSGEHRSDFAVSTNNCADRPLNPGVTCNVGITFAPTASGRRTALVEVHTPQGQYTSVVAAGDGAYEPQVALFDDEVVAGSDLLAFGEGYPANTEVQVDFGAGRALTVTTDEQGEFMALVPVPAAVGGGSQTVVVESSEGAAAAVDVDVIEQPEQLIGMPGFGLG